MKFLIITQTQRRQIVDSLENARPNEGCGLLAGKDHTAQRVYPIRNMLESPVAYEMDPLEQLDAMLEMDRDKLEMLAIYHSHPLGPAAPSITDIEKSYYPEAAHLIVSWDAENRAMVRAFSIRDGRSIAINLEIVE